MNLLRQAAIIEFPKICDNRGNLSFVEGARHVPFPIKRAFWIYDVPGGATRGAHSHKECYEVLVPAAGSLEVRLTDGRDEETYVLNRSNFGLIIPPNLWMTMHNFTTGTILIALASQEYDEIDYIRDYEEYLDHMKRLPKNEWPKLR